MDSKFEIEMCVLSSPQYLCVVRQAVLAAADRLGFDEEVCGQAVLGVDEAMCNVIRHGYDGDEDKPIWVKIGMGSEDGASGLVVIVEDMGRQVDPSGIAGRDLDDVRPGGLGVHIINEVMDEVEYQKRSEGGMRLTMKKFVRSAVYGNEITEGK